MPVFSFSWASKSASQPLPSVLAERNLSISSLKPLLMIPPSLILMGGSSVIELVINEVTSSNVSSCSYNSINKGDLKSFIIFLIWGNISNDVLKAIKSLGLADLYEILLRSLSKS